MWRREWDSNPRYVAVRRFSRPFRYDHFGISPCVQVILPHYFYLVKHFYVWDINFLPDKQRLAPFCASRCEKIPVINRL